MRNLPLPLPHKFGRLILLPSVIAVSGGIVWIGLSQAGWQQRPTVEAVNSQPQTLPSISALGRLEPTGEIIQVAAPLTLDGDHLAKD